MRCADGYGRFWVKEFLHFLVETFIEVPQQATQAAQTDAFLHFLVETFIEVGDADGGEYGGGGFLHFLVETFIEVGGATGAGAGWLLHFSTF